MLNMQREIKEREPINIHSYKKVSLQIKSVGSGMVVHVFLGILCEQNQDQSLATTQEVFKQNLFNQSELHNIFNSQCFHNQSFVLLQSLHAIVL